MQKEYIINENTLYIVKKDEGIEVFEIDNTIFLKDKTIKKFLNDSCTFYGSSLKGRQKGSESLITDTYKLPIIIKDRKLLVLFPIKEGKNTIWINYNNIIDYHQISKVKVLIEFKNKQTVHFNTSYYSFHQQILKCSRLIIVYNSRLM